MAKIIVQNTEITVLSQDEKDYISLTDMAIGKQDESRAADVIIKNWIRTRYAIEFLGTWETIHNPNFKVVEFDHFKMQAGLPSFTLSASEWIEKTNAIGIIVKKGRYGGTYAFKDIAFEFGTAISVTFKLKGNIRDYATINELICLSNMENINAVLINDGIPQGERLVKLNQIAIQCSHGDSPPCEHGRKSKDILVVLKNSCIFAAKCANLL